MPLIPIFQKIPFQGSRGAGPSNLQGQAVTMTDPDTGLLVVKNYTLMTIAGSGNNKLLGARPDDAGQQPPCCTRAIFRCSDNGATGGYIGVDPWTPDPLYFVDNSDGLCYYASGATYDCSQHPATVFNYVQVNDCMYCGSNCVLSPNQCAAWNNWVGTPSTQNRGVVTLSGFDQYDGTSVTGDGIDANGDDTWVTGSVVGKADGTYEVDQDAGNPCHYTGTLTGVTWTIAIRGGPTASTSSVPIDVWITSCCCTALGGPGVFIGLSIQQIIGNIGFQIVACESHATTPPGCAFGDPVNTCGNADCFANSFGPCQGQGQLCCCGSLWGYNWFGEASFDMCA